MEAMVCSFFIKKTCHPAKQINHTDKTWTNVRYTHSPNRIKNYEIDIELSSNNNIVYRTKTLFIDTIYTRGKPYDMKSFKKKKR